jgi:molybdopterin synthase catalytic subunit
MPQKSSACSQAVPSVSIQNADFDAALEYAQLRDSGAGTGAIATFTGLVRDSGDRQGVIGLFLEHYPGMTEQVISDVIARAGQRWDVRKARVIHRIGHLPLQSQIVFVGVCSAHRGDAFAACEFIMDALKASAPFWKKELTNAGEHWVEQKASDVVRSEDW